MQREVQPGRAGDAAADGETPGPIVGMKQGRDCCVESHLPARRAPEIDPIPTVRASHDAAARQHDGRAGDGAQRDSVGDRSVPGHTGSGTHEKVAAVAVVHLNLPCPSPVDLDERGGPAAIFSEYDPVASLTAVVAGENLPEKSKSPNASVAPDTPAFVVKSSHTSVVGLAVAPLR